MDSTPCKFTIYKSENTKMKSGEAEARAKEFIKQRHHRLERVFFAKDYTSGNVWTIEGEVEFKRLLFFKDTRNFEVQVNTNTGEIVSYHETQKNR